MNQNIVKSVGMYAIGVLLLGNSLFAGYANQEKFDALKNKKQMAFFLDEWKEMRGPRGERGKHGKHGKRGKQGKRGKNGKDGAGVISAYASMYTQQFFPLIAGSKFLFSSVTGQNNIDISQAATTGKVVIEQDGNYCVRFTVVAYNSSARVAIMKNGVEVPGSRVTVGQFTSKFTVFNECIITLTKGDYIQLQNVGSGSIAFEDDPDNGTTAELTLQKL